MFICSRTKFETITLNVFTFKHNFRFTIFVLLIGVFFFMRLFFTSKVHLMLLSFYFFVIWFARIQQLSFAKKKKDGYIENCENLTAEWSMIPSSI